MATVSVEKEDEADDTIELPEDYFYTNSPTTETPSENVEKVSSSDLEKELILELKFEDYSQEVLNNLIIALLRWSSIIQHSILTAKLEESTNKYYLQGSDSTESAKLLRSYSHRESTPLTEYELYSAESVTIRIPQSSGI